MTVLLASADPFARDAISTCLRQSWPFEQMPQIHVATDGPTAQHLIQHHAPALIILHWELPHTNAGQLLAHLRQAGNLTPTLIIDGADERRLPVNLHQLAAAYLHEDELTMTGMFTAIVEAMRRARHHRPTSVAPARPETAP